MTESDETTTQQAATGRGPRFEAAWSTLGRYPALVERKLLPDGAVRLAIKRDPRAMVIIIGVSAIFGALGIALTLFMGTAPASGEFAPVIGPTGRAKLLMLSILCVAMAAAVGLIRLMTGPGKPTVMELRPGRMKVDYSIAGDRIVREYTADALQPARAVLGEVMIETRVGFFTAAHDLPEDGRRALAELVNVVLWGELVTAEPPDV